MKTHINTHNVLYANIPFMYKKSRFNNTSVPQSKVMSAANRCDIHVKPVIYNYLSNNNYVLFSFGLSVLQHDLAWLYTVGLFQCVQNVEKHCEATFISNWETSDDEKN